MIQLSHAYRATGKAIVLTRWKFVGTVMSLLFNTLPMLVITFLLRSSSEIGQTNDTAEVKYRHELMSKILVLNFKAEWVSSRHSDRQL